MLRSSLLALGLIALFLAASPQAFSQGETTSAIEGQVADATAAAIPGAKVTVTNHDTGLLRSLKTDDQGRFNERARQASSRSPILQCLQSP
ncbi:MAG: hypothetical protein DMG38_17300 [Acidobacteria bacterium]|nr:MAG: hypothetical protein DMG38_17300 [Acidobacteriota bacterium]